MSTRDKLAFCFLMGRDSNATISDCQRLLRFAGALKRLSASADEEDSRKKIRIQRKVLALCAALGREVRFQSNGVVCIGNIEVPG